MPHFTNSTYKKINIILTATYSFCNAVLYFASINESPKELNITPYLLTNFNKNNYVGFTVFSIVSLASLVLYYSNYKSYHDTIDKILPKRSPNQWNNNFDEENQLALKSSRRKLKKCNTDFCAAITSSAFKAIVNSFALVNFLKHHIPNTTNLLAVSISILCLMGSFTSQLAIFAAASCRKKYKCKSTKFNQFITHLLTITYNIPNTTLYFNTGNAFINNIKILSKVKNTLLIFLWTSSIFLLISTQRAYSKKMNKTITEKNNNNDGYPKTEALFTCIDKVKNKLSLFFSIESYYSAGYKALINYFSFVNLMFHFSDNATVNLTVSCTMFFPLIISNIYAQYSILKTGDSPQQKLDSYFSSRKNTRACCSSLWYICSSKQQQQSWETSGKLNIL